MSPEERAGQFGWKQEKCFRFLHRLAIAPKCLFVKDGYLEPGAFSTARWKAKTKTYSKANCNSSKQ
jgi:hypothetical protein